MLANRFLYRLRDPRRGEIIVFKTPPPRRIKCGAGGTFVKRLIGLPGDTVELRLLRGNGYVYINGKRLKEPYIQQDRRAAVQSYGPIKVTPGNYFMMGDNRIAVVRLAHVGHGAAQEPDRQGLRDLLAAEPHLAALGARRGGRLCRRQASACPSGASSATLRRRGTAAFLPMSTIIQSIEQAQLREVPVFKAGDTVRVHFKVIEGSRQRVQVFEGVVIKRQGSGVRETFTVRKQSFGVGVERTFPLHSPKIEKLEVAMIGDVNRAKLYYLRGRVGKKARIRELRQP